MKWNFGALWKRRDPIKPETTRARLRLDPPLPLIYAVGDVHGCLDELIACERRIVDDAADVDGDRLIIMLGDYVDRGPRSAQVIDHLLEPPPAGFERICLAGNHEEAMLRFVDQPRNNMDWLDFGGVETLRSYGVDIERLLRFVDAKALPAVLRDMIPERHLGFIRDLPVAIDAGQHLYVHAGVRPGIALSEQSDRDLMWIREPFLSQGPGFPVTVVHGHTISQEPAVGRGRLGIDTGAYATGRLTAARIQGGVASVL
jgi:serine/threonine protein phosphatase 1